MHGMQWSFDVIVQDALRLDASPPMHGSFDDIV